MGRVNNAYTDPISIHALLAESDTSVLIIRQQCRNFYPRSPCGERRGKFGLLRPMYRHFYPRSPCGERRWLRCWQLAARDISIHALLAESDYVLVNTFLAIFKFLSTLSLRRATNINSSVNTADQISIHALLAESDLNIRQIQKIENGISIHALLAESDSGHDFRGRIRQRFLSTLSLRRATIIKDKGQPTQTISIHALLAESDKAFHTFPLYYLTFLSTLSLRRAT